MDKETPAENPAHDNQDVPTSTPESVPTDDVQDSVPEETERTPDILVINYGEYAPDDVVDDGYLPPLTEGDTLTQPTSRPQNPDETEEIEFEKYLRIFKEKTAAAAKKAKTSAGNFRRNSLIRFAKWAEPKLAPYRELSLPDKKSTKNNPVVPKDDQPETNTAEHNTPQPKAEVAGHDADETFELAEAAPYVPKTINEFLTMMRRTPRDVISPRERHVIATIMNFPNVKVSELMQPAENITYVNYDEVLGPLTLDRLYRAGYDHFPVVDSRHKIIGLIHTTALNSLEIKETSKAGDLLNPKVYYVREDYSLNQALAAFLRTNCYFFLVIDRYEKIVGLLTYQMLMSYLLGETPEDDFYRDNDRLAVAKRKLS